MGKISAPGRAKDPQSKTESGRQTTGRKRVENRQTRGSLTFGDFGTTERLFDDNVPTFARHVSKPTRSATGKGQTFRPKRNTDSVCKHVDALEDARTTLVGKLNFLVGATGENGASGLRGSTTERAGGAGRDVMHGVFGCEEVGGGRREKSESVMGRSWGRRERAERNCAAKRPFIICPFVWLSLTEDKRKKVFYLHQTRHDTVSRALDRELPRPNENAHPSIVVPRFVIFISTP